MTQQRRFAWRNGAAGSRGANPEAGFWSPTLTAKDPSIPWLPLETPAGGTQTGDVGLATETDTAFALTGARARSAGLATETDTALGLTGYKARSAGMATETDVALALTGAAAGAAPARPTFPRAMSSGFSSMRSTFA